MQPGDTITPGAQSPTPNEPPKVREVEVSLHDMQQPEQIPQPSPEKPAEQLAPPEQPPAPPAAEPQPEVTAPEPPQPPQPTEEWQYTPDSPDDPPPAPDRAPIEPVAWTASEYISHQKSPGWFLMIGAVLLIAVGVIYLMTQDFVAAGVVLLAGIIFAVFSARPPRVLNYSVNERGIQIGQRFYDYHEFKSFAVSDEGPLPSVLLMPLKRFLPPITVFYEPQSEDAIMNVLSSYLPFEQKPPDAVDKLMSRIRF